MKKSNNNEDFNSERKEAVLEQMDKIKQRLFDILLKNAFEKGQFVLSSGVQSSYYLDARKVTLTPEGAFLCASLILDIIKKEDIDAIGGPSLGADPMVGAIALLSFQQEKLVDTFIVRKNPKSYGKQHQIEGPPLKKGARVVLIDDVATTGKAFIHSIGVMRECGFNILKSICLVDRKQGARQALETLGCELISIFDIDQFLDAKS